MEEVARPLELGAYIFGYSIPWLIVGGLWVYLVMLWAEEKEQ